ncbi:MAG: DUF4352 domain-containing protein [Acidobacteria bacterium]|nr:DUF4352 domain-containing protein [Acidobacteriota bacterium]
MRILLLPALVLLAACRQTGDSPAGNTYSMGERVHLGPLTYNVLESEWRSQLNSTTGLRTPQKGRFLLIKLSITNGGSGDVGLPLLFLEDAKGQSYRELDEGVDGVEHWLGLLRNVSPAETEQGVIVFDVPPGAYKLRVSDGGDIRNEKTATIEIPYEIR